MKLYLRVGKDKYELPLAVADSTQELAKKCGISYKTITNEIAKWKAGEIKNPRFVVVEVDDD